MKGFDLALWPNKYKQPESRQPDARGTLSIPISVLRDLSQAYQAKELPTEMDERNNVEVVKLDASAWKNAPEGNKPVIKCEIRDWTEQKEEIARKAAKADGAGAEPAAAGWAPF
jgi:hypothetical protein